MAAPEPAPNAPAAPPAARDLVVDWRSYIVLWCLPVLAMIGALWAGHPARTLIWTGALAWMGIACLANARRCGRVHCRFTGPYFLLMAALTVLHGFGIVPLGADGWRWLGIATGAGTALIWWGSEAVLGRYFGRPTE